PATTDASTTLAESPPPRDAPGAASPARAVPAPPPPSATPPAPTRAPWCSPSPAGRRCTPPGAGRARVGAEAEARRRSPPQSASALVDIAWFGVPPLFQEIAQARLERLRGAKDECLDRPLAAPERVTHVSIGEPVDARQQQRRALLRRQLAHGCLEPARQLAGR